MNTKALLYPEWRILLGCNVLRNGLQLELMSSKEARADWCQISLDMSLREKLEINDGDIAIIELGYGDDFDCVLTGKVSRPNPKDWPELMIKDDMSKLENIIVKGTFMDCTPQDILKYIMVLSDIETCRFSQQEYGKKNKLTISARNGVEAIKAINASWGIDNNFFIRNSIFYWGIRPEQNYIYTLDNGNVLDISKLGDCWEVATLGVPWIHHSDLICLNHVKVSGVFEVEKVSIKNDREGCIRQYLYFKEGD